MMTCTNLKLISIFILHALLYFGLLSCNQPFDHLAALRLEQIKSEILSKLGLDEPPKINADQTLLMRPQIARYLAHLGYKQDALNDKYNSSIHSAYNHHEHEFSDTTVEHTIVIAERPSAALQSDSPIGVFKFSSDLTKREVNTATLTIFIRKPETGPSNENDLNHHITVQIIVKEVLKNGTIGDHIAERKRLVNLKNVDYVQIPLRVDDVQRWFDSGNSEKGFLGLAAYVLYNGENLVVKPSDTSDTMYFELITHNPKQRKRRSFQEMCTREMNEKGCCLYSFPVDFHKAGWDFIVEPKVYDARICSGECRPDDMLQSRHNALLITETGKVGCCHPSAYQGQKLIYLTKSLEINLTDLNDLIAAKCSCS